VNHHYGPEGGNRIFDPYTQPLICLLDRALRTAARRRREPPSADKDLVPPARLPPR